MTEFQTWVIALGKTTTYQSWAKKNPNDAIKWSNFTKAIIAGNTFVMPTMSTGFGKSLVKIVEIAMSGPQAGFGVSTFGEGSFGEEVS